MGLGGQGEKISSYLISPLTDRSSAIVTINYQSHFITDLALSCRADLLLFLCARQYKYQVDLRYAADFIADLANNRPALSRHYGGGGGGDGAGGRVGGV